MQIIFFLLICGTLLLSHNNRVYCVEPTAVQIVRLEDNSVRVNSSLVNEILGNDHIKDRHVMIFSIAGPYRKGKSFFLNFALKYFRAQYVKHDMSDWIGENGVSGNELHGFKWRGGLTPQTTGIWMWSEIFTHDFDNGDRVAIILLDTQGIFDHETSAMDTTATFAISTMLSSVQCYNVMQNVQEDNLQNLDFFTQYGRLAMGQSNEKPFQKLLFIVRDWPYADDKLMQNSFATAEASLLILHRYCLNKYVTKMQQVMDRHRFFQRTSDLLEYHGIARKESLEQFQNTPKLLFPGPTSSYRAKLEKDITNQFNNFKQLNEDRLSNSGKHSESSKDNNNAMNKLVVTGLSGTFCALLGWNPFVVAGCAAAAEALLNYD